MSEDLFPIEVAHRDVPLIEIEPVLVLRLLNIDLLNVDWVLQLTGSGEPGHGRGRVSTHTFTLASAMLALAGTHKLQRCFVKNCIVSFGS